MRLRLDLLEGEPVGDLAVAVAPRPGAHLEVEHAAPGRRGRSAAQDVGGVEPLRSAERVEAAVVERVDVDVVVGAAGAAASRAG